MPCSKRDKAKAICSGVNFFSLTDFWGFATALTVYYSSLIEKVKAKDPAYEAPVLTTPASGGCYVATAVYGSYDCPQVWTVPCDIALPCATQNEINKESAEALVKNGCTVVCEGANMPSTPEAIEVYLSNGVLYGPAKAANAGGVATSGLEMSQNSERLSWTFEEVDAKLKGIMEGIFHASYDASVAAGSEGNLMVGANCAGFLKVATAMMAQGITY